MADKTFPLSAVLGIVTGRSWGGSFSDIHECAEHVMGHPIWTHEFASQPLWDEMRRRVLVAHPGLADVSPDACPTSPDNLAERMAPQVARFGEALTIPAGIGVREKSPMQTAAEMMGDPERVIVASISAPTE